MQHRSIYCISWNTHSCVRYNKKELKFSKKYGKNDSDIGKEINVYFIHVCVMCMTQDAAFWFKMWIEEKRNSRWRKKCHKCFEQFVVERKETKKEGENWRENNNIFLRIISSCVQATAYMLAMPYQYMHAWIIQLSCFSLWSGRQFIGFIVDIISLLVFRFLHFHVEFYVRMNTA